MEKPRDPSFRNGSRVGLRKKALVCRAERPRQTAFRVSRLDRDCAVCEQAYEAWLEFKGRDRAEG